MIAPLYFHACHFMTNRRPTADGYMYSRPLPVLTVPRISYGLASVSECSAVRA